LRISQLGAAIKGATSFSSQEKPFWKNNYTKDGCKGKKSLHRRKTIFCVFVYLCIGANKSQP
jgi:hypothetical protein